MSHNRKTDTELLIQFTKDKGFDQPDLMEAVVRLEMCHREELLDYGTAAKIKSSNVTSSRERQDLGRVNFVNVERGFLSPTISTITTDKGTYRVKGDVKSVDKGELVSKRGDELCLGVVNQNRKFTLV